MALARSPSRWPLALAEVQISSGGRMQRLSRSKVDSVPARSWELSAEILDGRGRGERRDREQLTWAHLKYCFKRCLGVCRRLGTCAWDVTGRVRLCVVRIHCTGCVLNAGSTVLDGHRGLWR